jgi:hypothetical protein
VIDSVASIYSGQIGYASNWDNFNSTRVTSNIWSHPEINYIGVDSYFRFESGSYVIPTGASDPIQTYPDPSFIQLVADEWNQRLDEQILPFAASLAKPVVFTEQGYQHHNGTSRNPQTGDQHPNSIPVDAAEQVMAFQGLLRAQDGRQNVLRAMHIWQWEMSGSQGSTWNINPLPSANQPDNIPLAKWLSGFVTNLLPGDYSGDGVVDASDYVVWRNSLGQAVTYFSGADGNGSGLIDAADFDVWKANFGSVTGSGAALAGNVPEPATIWLLLAASCGVAVARRPGVKSMFSVGGVMVKSTRVSRKMDQTPGRKMDQTPTFRGWPRGADAPATRAAQTGRCPRRPVAPRIRRVGFASCLSRMPRPLASATFGPRVRTTW